MLQCQYENDYQFHKFDIFFRKSYAGKPEFAAFTPLESRYALLDGCISGHSPSISPRLLGALHGFLAFFGQIPSVSPRVLGVLLGFFVFSGQIPSVSPRMLGALLGLTEVITKNRRRPYQKHLLKRYTNDTLSL